MRVRRVLTIAVAVAGLAMVTLPAHATPTARSIVDCVAPAGDPAEGTEEWKQRDAQNMYCATERLQDEVGNPTFGAVFGSQTPGMYAGQNIAMLTNPTHPHASLSQVLPGGTTTDPFRTIDRWTAAGRGRATPISFTATDGATLNGFVFEPPASVPGPYPGIVITTGSIQGYQQMYFWAAEGLAEAGYLVLTYDVQGQGDSDTLPGTCAPTPADLQSGNICQGVPFQQAYNFVQGTRDALDFMFSSPDSPFGGSSNPAAADLDRDRVGLAGHSLGASAVSQVGQEDPRVKAIVAWDNLAPVAEGTLVHAPALGINSEYFFNPSPMSSSPDPHAKDSAFNQLAAAGIDSMQVALRSSTHLEYSYVPYILPASALGERVAFYYSLAWFDRYVRGSTVAFDRLVATQFDDSSDVHSIGGGSYDAAAALANPTDPAAGNVPHVLAGLPVADRVSIYYASGYALTDPSSGARVTCADLRHGC